jgi:hypothetical protein
VLLTERSFLVLDVLRRRDLPSDGFAFQAPFGGDQIGAGSMIPPAADLPLTIKKIVCEVLEGELLRSL